MTRRQDPALPASVLTDIAPKRRRVKVDGQNVQETPCTSHLREITVVYPEQTFSPIPFNTFKCGGIFYKTFVRPGESDEDAYERAWAFVEKLAREQYSCVRADFFARYNGEAT